MEATLLEGVDLGDDEAPFYEAMEELSAHAFAAYRGLVYETPGFIDYFRASTPINEIGDLNIGSRPAGPPQLGPHRGPARDPVGVQLGPVAPVDPGLLRLRHGGEAVPGQGSATRKRRLAALRAMYARWPFFRTLVDRLDMVLAKMDIGIAARYAALVPDRKLRKTVFDAHRARARRHAARPSSRSRRRRRCWRTTRRSRAACATASRTSIR